jgi:tetratricopeptide (TPR) repeat protein
VHALNAWQLARADSLFQQAIAADSTFALAYYRRALTLGWSSPGDSTQLALVARARDLSARLPRREREIVSAYSDLTGALSAEFAFDTARRNALFRSAQAKYAAIVQRDSGAAEGWYGLGDAYYHHRPTGQGGRETASNMSRSLRAFDRTLALDSSFHLAYSHKIDLYGQTAGAFSGLVLDGDSLLLLPDEAARQAYGEQRLAAARERARQLAVRDGRLWVEANPVPQAYQGLAQVYMQAGTFDSAVAVLQEGVRLHPEVRDSYIAYGLPAVQARTDPVAALASLRTALREVTGQELRDGGGSDRFSIVLAGASAAAVGGSVADLREAARVAVEAEPTIVGLGISREPQAQWLVAGTLLALGLPPARHLAVIDSGMRGLDRMKAPVGPQIRQFSTPPLYIAYLATREARYLDALRRWRAESGVTQPFAELDALEALSRGDTAGARAQAARFPSPDSTRTAKNQISPMRWIARAEVLEALGDHRGAVAMYEVLDPRRFGGNGPLDPGLALYPRSYLDRGRLLEQLGEPARAAEAYERFLELWKDADPALEPQKKEAREGLERVRKGMGPRG